MPTDAASLVFTCPGTGSLAKTTTASLAGWLDMLRLAVGLHSAQYALVAMAEGEMGHWTRVLATFQSGQRVFAWRHSRKPLPDHLKACSVVVITQKWRTTMPRRPTSGPQRWVSTGVPPKASPQLTPCSAIVLPRSIHRPAHLSKLPAARRTRRSDLPPRPPARPARPPACRPTPRCQRTLGSTRSGRP